ncbi:MAG: hypothetical protein LBP79_07310 [Clostridiales bacterium]|jgi:hypothetical protein|nr:hypothetical protein [Clostridiales bacterium]
MQTKTKGFQAVSAPFKADDARRNAALESNDAEKGQTNVKNAPFALYVSALCKTGSVNYETKAFRSRKAFPSTLSKKLQFFCDSIQTKRRIAVNTVVMDLLLVIMNRNCENITDAFFTVKYT